MGRVRRLVVVVCTVAVASAVASCGSSGGSSGAEKTSGGGIPTAVISANALGQREMPEVRRMLERMVAGVNSRDVSICTQLYTRHYVEALMQRRGAAAIAQCRRQVAGSQMHGSIKQIERVELERSHGVIGGKVQVLQQIAAGTQGSLIRSTFAVVRTPRGYRIDDGNGTSVQG